MATDFANEDFQILGLTFLMGSVTSKQGVINRADTKEEQLALLKQFHSDFDINWPFVIATGHKDRTNFDNYSEMGVPMIVIVDKKGIIRRIKTGHDPTMKAEIALLNRLLKEQ